MNQMIQAFVNESISLGMRHRVPIEIIAVTNHFQNIDSWSAGWFMFHADDQERIDYLRQNGFAHIVVVDSELDRDDFDILIDAAMTAPWTKVVEVLGHRPGPRFRVTVACARAADAIMARMIAK